jgi:hypothetical protein
MEFKETAPGSGHYVNPYTQEVCSREKYEKLWKEIHEDRKRLENAEIHRRLRGEL